MFYVLKLPAAFLHSLRRNIPVDGFAIDLRCPLTGPIECKGLISSGSLKKKKTENDITMVVNNWTVITKFTADYDNPEEMKII